MKQFARLGLFAMTAILAVMMFANTVSAGSVFNETTHLIGERLGVSQSTVGFILSTCVLLAVALMLAMVKLPGMGIIIVLIGTMGMCTILGWLPIWVPALAALLTAGLWGAKFAGWLGGGGGE
jgi:hypothetical protein